MTPEERASLRSSLIAEQIAGDTNTPRSSVVRNAELLAGGDPDKSLGFEFGAIAAQEVIDAVAALCGCSADLGERDGPGVIDAEKVLDALDAMGERLGEASLRSERVLIATGHPTGLLPLHQAVSRGLAAAGCKILTPLSDSRMDPLPGQRDFGFRPRFRYLDGVGCLSNGADLYHTHEAWPAERLLDATEVPDLVLADHGFAGAAIVRGIETLSFADVNDPALAVAKARGLTRVVVPLDDNREPERYAEITAYLLSRLR